MPVLKCQLLCAVPEIGQIDHNYFLIPNSRLFFRKIFQISNAVISYWVDRKYLPLLCPNLLYFVGIFNINISICPNFIFYSSQIMIFFYFY